MHRKRAHRERCHLPHLLRPGARATLHIGGKTYAFAGGGCDSASSTFNSIDLGTITLPPGKPKYRYFGITVFAANRDGTSRQDQADRLAAPGRTAHNALFHATDRPDRAAASHGVVLRARRLAGNHKPGSGTFQLLRCPARTPRRR